MNNNVYIKTQLKVIFKKKKEKEKKGIKCLH